MRSYQCVKTIEAILQEQGAYNIEIDLASGFVSFLNTSTSGSNIVNSILSAGFGCTLLQQQTNNVIGKDFEMDKQLTNYMIVWVVRVIITCLSSVVMFCFRTVYKTSPVVTYTNFAVSVGLLALNFPCLKTGIWAAIKRKQALPETENAIAALLNVIVNLALVVQIAITQEKNIRDDLSRLDISNGTAAILAIVTVARFIEQIGKRNAVKNFQGLAQQLPEEVYAVKNLNLEDIVKFFKSDSATIKFPT